ncbi:hypothetical protein Z517_05067 [Fonsecaea pedrosoi CBS 271.37]|uniref:Unplaced genomic scaffold supercont1.3, whole genome shotgun sequence n=1 Tax=Fonsecaea pedrosoi CBS 271.37 TaxID=1442368 RepID=A0A0D2GU17_9EURO|nr:uncharacterized protein Z517_05067 [Fonsecaea pedrosoi CBS 271.37]KIW82040.1 hypothetical protein Z517_05067 [Fonsecaea pedrosoi CBS 271.37]
MSSAQEHFAKVASVYEKGTGGATRRVATHLVQLASPIKADAKILDNACGTGVVIDELLAGVSDAAVRNSLMFTVTDAAAPMVECLLSKIGTQWDIPADHVTALTLAAEDLDGIASDSFDYSFTNFGFLFFKDAEKAAKHIYRTLKPGGRAFVTSWKDLGYMQAIEKAAVQVRPHHPPPHLPFDTAWLDSAHIKDVFEQAGFQSVDVHQQASSYASESVPALSHSLVGMMEGMLKMQGWSDSEVESLPPELERAIEGLTDALVIEPGAAWIKMMAHVAVCVK